MSKAKERQKMICKILQDYDVSTQNDLMEMLEREGMGTTQATLSRDMNKLGVVRTKGVNDRYVYKLPLAEVQEALARKRIMSVTKGYIGYNFSGNILIVHTLGGFAHSISVEIETRRRPEIAGTLAGDDTILILPNDGYGRSELAAAIAAIVGVDKPIKTPLHL